MDKSVEANKNDSLGRADERSNDCPDQAVSFEESLRELEAVVRQLENGEVSLEESLKLFEKGVRLARICAQKLDECEARIEILLEQNGEFIREPFSPEE